MSKTFATDVTIGTTGSCNICGHESHCGSPLWKEVRDYASEQGPTHRSIEVCKSCSCTKCSTKQSLNNK